MCFHTGHKTTCAWRYIHVFGVKVLIDRHVAVLHTHVDVASSVSKCWNFKFYAHVKMQLLRVSVKKHS